MEDIIFENLTVNYEKNTQSVYIKDENGRILFIVSLITLEEKESWEGKKYLVKVVEIHENQLPFDLIREFFEDKQEAIRTMKNMVRDYQVLVRGPIGDEVDTREIFNDEVNYRKIDPDCCGNCGFCILHHTGEGPDEIIYLCSYKKNLRENEYTRELFGKYSSCKDMREIGDMIQVEEDCVCNNYTRARD